MKSFVLPFLLLLLCGNMHAAHPTGPSRPALRKGLTVAVQAPVLLQGGGVYYGISFDLPVRYSEFQYRLLPCGTASFFLESPHSRTRFRLGGGAGWRINHVQFRYMESHAMGGSIYSSMEHRRLSALFVQLDESIRVPVLYGGKAGFSAGLFQRMNVLRGFKEASNEEPLHNSPWLKGPVALFGPAASLWWNPGATDGRFCIELQGQFHLPLVMDIPPHYLFTGGIAASVYL